eukprot:tig00021435_g21383.t1
MASFAVSVALQTPHAAIAVPRGTACCSQARAESSRAGELRSFAASVAGRRVKFAAAGLLHRPVNGGSSFEVRCDAKSEIDRATVENVAELARLNLSEEEIKQLTPQLQKILAFVSKMDELDTENVVPMCFADGAGADGGAGLENVLSENDEVRPFEEREALQAIFPETEGPFVRVPKVLAADMDE